MRDGNRLSPLHSRLMLVVMLLLSQWEADPQHSHRVMQREMHLRPSSRICHAAGPARRRH